MAVGFAEEYLPERVADITSGGIVDVVLECSGAEAAIADTPALVRKAGVVFIGLPQDPCSPDGYLRIDR